MKISKQNQTFYILLKWNFLAGLSVFLLVFVFASCNGDKNRDANETLNLAFRLFDDYQYEKSLVEFGNYLELAGQDSLNCDTFSQVCRNMAVCASMCNSISYADSLFDKAFLQVAKKRDSLFYCSLLIDFAIHNKCTNRFEKSIELLKNARTIAGRNYFLELKTHADILLAENFRLLNNEKTSRLFLDELKGGIDTLQSARLRALYYAEAAMYNIVISYFPKSEENAEKSIQAAYDDGAKDLMALSYLTLCRAKIYNRTFSQLNSYLDSALHYSRLANNKIFIARYDLLWIRYLIRTSKNDKALERIGELEQNPIFTSDSGLNFELLYHKSKVYTNWKNYDKSISLLELANTFISRYSDVTIWQQLVKDLSIQYISNRDSLTFVFLDNSRTRSRNLQNAVVEFQCVLSISRYFEMMKDFENSSVYLDSAQQILNRNENLKLISEIYTQHARNVYFQGKREQALKLYQKAVEIDSIYNSRWRVAFLLFNMSAIYNKLKKDEQWEKYSNDAIKIFQQSGNKKIASLILEITAKDFYKRGNQFEKTDPAHSKNLNKVIAYAKEAILLKEEIRQTSDDDSRKKYLNAEFGIYQMLISCYQALGDKAAEFEAIEISKTKWLEEKISHNPSARQAISLHETQQKMDDNTLVLNYAKRIESFYHASALDNSEYYTKTIFKREFVGDSLKLLHGFLDYLKENISDKKFNKYLSQPTDKLHNKFVKEIYYHFISYYRSLLQNSSFTPEQKTAFEIASKSLYRFLIAPFADYLSGKNILLIIPDGLLGFVPFETLINENGQYLVELFEIRYIQSMSVWHLLNDRTYNNRGKDLIAFGGAEYSGENVNLSVDSAEAYLPKDNVRSSVVDIYEKYGYDSFYNIPGSKNEVERISEEFRKSKVYTGKKVSENLIKQLSEDEKLGDYKVMHFSTHGVFIPEHPNLSAIVLPAGDSSEDGFLHANEIATLNLKADFVNLSACETGLGKIYEGEGVIGIAQSFVIAGANSLSVSLWQVADNSTSTFMTELYKMVRDEGISYSVAMNRIKRKFINGDYHQAQVLPYFWAPFIYYGK